MFRRISLLFYISIFSACEAGDCAVRGVDPDAPVLCGAAVQGGLLFGESEWTVSGPNAAGRDKIFVIGLPMDAAPALSLEFCKNETCRKYDYAIKQRKYPEQRVKVDDKFVEYPAGVQKRVADESARIKEALAARNFDHLDFLDTRAPFGGKYKSSGRYGSRRVFNGTPKNPHKGWDIAAPRGAPVNPVARGRVALAISGYLTGNTVIVSHGYGVCTVYMHLDKMLVRAGDSVGFDSVLGTVGSTGRAAGPHLHLGLYAYGIALDPELLFSQNL